jgi:hypothetical protein
MKRNSFIYTCLFMSLLLLTTVKGKAQQIKSFTPDSVKFIPEMVQYGSMSYSKEALPKYETLLTMVWTDKRLQPVNRQQLYKLANTMLANRLRPDPHFVNLFNVISLFLNKNQTPKSLTNWLNGVQLITNTKLQRQFVQVIDATARLFDNNTLYKSASSLWTIRQGTFAFEADSVPYAVFKAIDLVCRGYRDSTQIIQTSGRFYPSNDTWRGKGGTVYWDRAGFAHADVYTLLDDYTINLHFSSYKADSAKLINKKYFKAPLPGRFEEMVQASVVTPDRAVYPKFDSYSKKLFLDKIFENINYEGGFFLEGSRFIGTGSNKTDAKIVFLNAGKPFASVISNTFVIRTDRIAAARVAVAVFYETDSIYNGSVQMLYLNSSKEVSFTRTEDGAPSSPFYDTYHKLDIQVEAMTFKLGDQNIRFEMSKGLNKSSKAYFESANFYNEQKYARLQGIDEVNPINVVYFYTQMTKRDEFLLQDLADYMKKPVEQVRAMLSTLAANGFILFNSGTNLAILKPKIKDFLAARAGKKDYDVIRFNSDVNNTANATMNMKNGDLTIFGVSEVAVSDTKNVYIYPVDQKLIIKKGLDFVFTGRVHGGFFDFYANKSSFEYNKFKLNMPVIDSMTFVVKSFKADNEGNRAMVPVRSSIQKLSGELLIDSAQNKSGRQKYPQYPVFVSKTPSFVYYDRKDILNGAYPKDKFFYTVSPFRLDSLNNFSTDGLAFKGSLTTGKLFPESNEPIKVQPDYSLGFVEKVPAAGIPVYGGKGIFYDKISLSNNGLRGSGRLQAYTSESESDNYIFYSDSLTGVASKFSLASKALPVAYPSVKGETVTQKWIIAQDLMLLTSAKDKPFSMINDKVLLSGQLKLTSKDLKGNGHVVFNQADMNAKLYAFRQKGFTTDTTAFKINAADGSGVLLQTVVSRSDVDFVKNLANFATSGQGARIEFPVNKYIGSMNQFTWMMDQEKVVLQNNIAQRIQNFNKLTKKELIDADLSSSEFVSTLPGKDPLRFSSLQATYDLKLNILYGEDVKIIKVADAAVFPTDGRVTILKNGSMKAFDDATIIANRVNKSHTIYGAKVTVQNSKSYYASGIYDYADESGQSQQIRFSKIGVDTTGQTIANATISDSASFKLNPAFGFMGDVELRASSKFLSFKGGFRINNICETKNDPQWVKFKAEVDPMNVMLPVTSDPRNLTNEKLMSSIAFSITQNVIYAPFYIKPVTYSDLPMTPAEGFIRYDKKLQSYIIATDPKDLKNTTGNQLILDTRRCILSGSGKVNLGAEFGKLTMDMMGNSSYKMIPDSLNLDVLASIDFFFSDLALEKFKDDLQLANLKGINLNGEVVNKALKLTMGDADFKQLAEDMSLYGATKKGNDKLSKTMVLTDVKLKWNADTRSFIGTGPIGIFSLGKFPVNKYVNGYVEITRRRSGDILNLYFELAKGNWYFFTYTAGVMQTISSNEDYNKILSDLKDDKRTLSVKAGEETYQYIISTPEKRLAFTRKMLQLFPPTQIKK